MPSYYLRTTGMSRGINDGTAKKTLSTWHREYFRLSDDGLLSSVSEFEDGLLFYSAPAQLPAPAAGPCPAALFNDAHARCVAYLRQQEAERERAKEFTKSLKDGLLFSTRAEKAAAPERMALAPSAHFLHDFTVFDCETTGFSAEKNHLLELAAVRYVNFLPVAEYQSFVRCPVPVPGHITNLTGIQTHQVRQAPEAKAVLQQFRKLAGDSLLVGHNVGFDLGFVNAARARLGAPDVLANDFLCTLVLAAHREPAPHKLGELCQRFGIRTTGAHRALNDVRMTFALLRALHEKQPVTPDFVNRTGKPGKRATASIPTLFKAA